MSQRLLKVWYDQSGDAVGTRHDTSRATGRTAIHERANTANALRPADLDLMYYYVCRNEASRYGLTRKGTIYL